MNKDHLESIFYTQKLAWLLGDANHDYSKVRVVILAPFTDLRSLQTLIQADKLALEYGAQDLSIHRTGSYTGEVSAKMLSKLGCQYVLAGHTERRKFFGENDEIMLKKATRALEENVKPILCIGELDEEAREHPDFDFLYAQLEPIVKKINSIGKSEVIPFLENVMIAYEPRWAVSNGQTCTPEFLQEVMKGLRERMVEELGEEAAYKIKLLYGGSVNLNTVAPIILQDEVDGILVGKASLNVEDFTKIIRVVSKTIEK
ncbi:triosephosphate isomerase [Actinomycetota bacterium]|nr:triosephosphate isomerase [Actinomycetota bacterium]